MNKLQRIFPLLFLLPILVTADNAFFDGRNVDIKVAATGIEENGESLLVTTTFIIQPEWHIYWKNPGTTGMPTEINWRLPEGIEFERSYYPAPKVYNSDGLIDYVYEGEVTIVTQFNVSEPSKLKSGDFNIHADISWLECKNVCVPGNATLEIDLAKLDSFSEQTLGRIQQTIDLDQKVQSGSFSISENKVSFLFPLPDLQSVGEVYFFSESGITNSESAQLVDSSNGRILIQTELSPYFEKASEDEFGLLTYEIPNGSKQALRFELKQVSAQSLISDENPSPQESANLALLILLAYVGGLILNLMPCVFPVIGLKIMGFVEQAGQDSKKIMMHGLVFASGVVVSFWVLSGMLLILRSGGEQLGWGFQLQEPWFNYALIVLLLTFALSLNGVFEFGMSAIGVGSKLQQKSGTSGSFFSGVLATVVATPCSAPFLAPALGAALTLEPAQSLLVFTFIAVGLSTPYLLLSMFPKVLNKMPRPGAWMETFKQFMAFPLYGTVAYLLWAIFGQIDDANQFNLLLSLVGVALALWIYGRWATPVKPKATRLKASIAALLIMIGSIVYGHPKEKKNFWEPWSPELVEKYIDEGKTVYVDFTARWCATCQLNKRVVFSSDEVLEIFESKDVVALKADWTNRDERITVRLRELGKAAVPVNLVYKKGEDEPVILPEVLTPSIVLNALQQ